MFQGGVGSVVVQWDIPDAWGIEAIGRRYGRACRGYGQARGFTVLAWHPGHAALDWAHVLRVFADAIRSGDVAAAEVGVEFLHEDRGFPFGLIIKEDIARALYSAPSLSVRQRHRLKLRLLSIMRSGRVPREFGVYVKLLRRVGDSASCRAIGGFEARNRHAQRAQRYVVEHLLPEFEARGM